MKKYELGVREFLTKTWLIAALCLPAGVAQAESKAGQEVPPGTIIDASTYDDLKDALFEGKRIGDMILSQKEFQIRNEGARMELVATQANDNDYRVMQATERYKGTAKVDPNTYDIMDYQSGIPFPEIAENDPAGGAKAIWNLVYGSRTGDSFHQVINFVFVDADIGVERIQKWWLRRYHMLTRVGANAPMEGDGSIFHRTLLTAQYPQDVRGIGTFTIRYSDGRLDDTWAYIRTVRRVRRLSGGAWVDTIGGTDEIQDDIFHFNAYPGWYKNLEIKGKRWVLASAYSRHPGHEDDGLDAGDYPGIVSDHAPYWARQDVYQPREVWIVECIPPEIHPYSKKILYIQTDNWYPQIMDAWDKKGEYWKWSDIGWFPAPVQDGFIDPESGKVDIMMAPGWASFIDYQRRHATHTVLGGKNGTESYYYVPGAQASDYSLTALEEGGR